MANTKLTNFDHLQAAMTKVKEYVDAVDSTKAASDHVHGNLTNSGTLLTANAVVVTDANKKVTASTSITTTELSYLDGVTSAIQTQLNGKSASTHVHGNISNTGALATANAVVVTDGNKNILASTTITTTELGYLDNVTSNIQTQLNGKAASGHVHGNITNGGALGTANAVVVTDGSKLVTASTTITTTELGYLDGVTSKIQDQLNGKAGTEHGTHVTYATATPKAAGTAAVGTSGKLAREDHVHPVQTSVSGNAGSANKVNNNLIVKLNSGTTEGTNLFTYNGSDAKTINITPASIGAAGSSHGTHVTWATNAPKAPGTAAIGTVDRVAKEDHVHPVQTSVTGNAGSADKVNQSLKIQLNGGTTEGTNQYTFNGSEAKTVNITPAKIGASASTHTHDVVTDLGGIKAVATKDTTTYTDLNI